MSETKWSIQHEEVKFWFVWTKNRRVPRFAWDTAAQAEKEAIRLSKLHPGRKFIVLEAMSKFSATEKQLAEAGLTIPPAI